MRPPPSFSFLFVSYHKNQRFFLVALKNLSFFFAHNFENSVFVHQHFVLIDIFRAASNRCAVRKPALDNDHYGTFVCLLFRELVCNAQLALSAYQSPLLVLVTGLVFIQYFISRVSGDASIQILVRRIDRGDVQPFFDAFAFLVIGRFCVAQLLRGADFAITSALSRVVVDILAYLLGFGVADHPSGTLEVGFDDVRRQLARLTVTWTTFISPYL